MVYSCWRVSLVGALTAKLRGLEPDARYRATWYSGSALMEEGLTCKGASQRSADIVMLVKA